MPVEAQAPTAATGHAESTAPAAQHPDWQADDTLLNHLARNAREVPDRVAMRERDHGIWQEYTWSDYLERVLALAAGLEQYGLKAGEQMLVIGDNRPALYFAMLSAGALRAVPSPAYPDATPQEIGDQVQRESIRVALGEDQEQVDKLLEIQKSYPQLELIVYDDPRGLKGKEPDGVVGVETLVEAGRTRLQTEPGLREDLLGRARVHDVAVLLHSSGTTGAPKGVPLKHGHVLFAVRNAAAAGYFREGEVHMAFLPMAWVGDFTFSVGAAILLRFSVNIPETQETAQKDIREIAPTMYFSGPRAWSNLLTRIQVGIDESTPFKRWLYNRFMPFAVELERRRLEGHQPGVGKRLWRALGELLVYGPIRDQLGLRRVGRPYTAGEAMGEEVFLFFRALGLELRQFYGQTETAALTAAQDPDAVKLHTVGKPFPGVEIKISDAGEILVKGDNVFDGYFQRPDATAETLQDDWLYTGDAGYIEDDGQLVVQGRVKEVVYTAGGARFIPTFIENRIKFSHFIRDICILGEARDVLTAIVCIDIDAVGHWAEERGVPYTSYADLSQKDPVYDLIAGVLQRTNETLPEGLQIRRFVNLHKPFDPDDGEVTRTRKLRRNVIDEHYRPIIEALYGGDASIEYKATFTYETGETGEQTRRLQLRDITSVGGATGRRAAQ
ncbi:AMP-dependent synthetase/ligase [Rhodovibrio salinarum]|uniref:Long-chain fatty acid--CoA ligase n=1 Tax=Rhodovibrio salinarum TaxID=1087 RepID=A0A934QJ98_9PROT|nr:AMP-binding protein [Rhodovibrio salinarum]MBK1698063.1 long-chain fatty acid--CoA ligase [Rhodovibrio salinarum]